MRIARQTIPRVAIEHSIRNRMAHPRHQLITQHANTHRVLGQDARPGDETVTFAITRASLAPLRA